MAWDQYVKEDIDGSNIKRSITIEEALAFVVFRGEVCQASCNSFHINATIAQMRAVCWLFSKKGQEPPAFNDIRDALDYLGIVYVNVDGEMIFWGKDMDAEVERYKNLRAEHGKEEAFRLCHL